MLADDQHLVREGICSLLTMSDAVEVVAQVHDGKQVVDGVARFGPDVVLLDIRMPGMSGIEALHALREQGMEVPVILLTTFDDDEFFLQGMKAGAKGFLLKDVTLESLVKAIEAVHRGDTYIQPVVTERILKGMGNLRSEFGACQVPEALSEKEIEILRLMAGGFNNREISQSIHKSEGTVKNQVSSILNKLGVRDRTRAVLRALDRGIIG
jgi:DNA-binding NarL/FixJ family response regulator